MFGRGNDDGDEPAYKLSWAGSTHTLVLTMQARARGPRTKLVSENFSFGRLSVCLFVDALLCVCLPVMMMMSRWKQGV